MAPNSAADMHIATTDKSSNNPQYHHQIQAVHEVDEIDEPQENSAVCSNQNGAAAQMAPA